MNTRKDFLEEDIVSELKDLDIAWYILDEVKNFLKYVNHYKLANIYENMEDFKEYLLMVDKQNSIQISQLEVKDAVEESIQSDLIYYISQSGIDMIDSKKIELISNRDLSLSNIMQWIKWYIILTVDEFCNASKTRMSINKMLFEKKYCLS